MKTSISRLLALVAVGAVLPAIARAQAAAPPFAAPVRLQAGGKFLGENRLYPSPVFHDLNGDGRLDIVVGDLMGRLTVALRLPGDGAPAYGAETKVLATDGKDLKFNNW